MYQLITSAKDIDDLSIDFDRDRGWRRDELTSNKNRKGKYHVSFMLRDVLGFAEHQERTTYSFGYILTLTGNKDEAVLDKATGIPDARFKIDQVHCYMPQYVPSIQQQGVLPKQFLIKIPTQLRYIERSVFMKEVNVHNLWKFELGSQESMNVPLYINIGFHQRDRQDSLNLNNDTFCRLLVTSAQCIIGAEKNPDAGLFLNYNDDGYSHGYGQINEVFRALAKDDILQPYISNRDFRSSKVKAHDVCYKLCFRYKISARYYSFPSK